jgi:3-oxoacyl-[acyl-carrier protein] reductase
MQKTAYITGGYKGIGLGIAKALLAEGYNVVISGRNSEVLNAKVDQLDSQYPGKVLGMTSDVRDIHSLNTMADKALKQWGSIDVVIANAGVGFFADVEEMSIEDWDETIATNLNGVFYTLKATLPALKASKGYFITIASLAGANFFPRGAAYNASKFGLVGFTQAAMLDLRKHGIKTTTIMPGSVATEFNNHTPGPEDEWKIQIEDIGQMVLDLLRMPERTLPSKIEVRPSFPK